MGVTCGSMPLICEFPVALDTYRGCSHGCLYCFARRSSEIGGSVRPLHCTESVKRFTEGKRTGDTNWCDWNIPLHWGAMSDPFQPAEREHGASLEVLELLAEKGYPFIVSTKGRLCAEEPYLSLLAESNVVVQVSMAAPVYDEMEPGAPTFAERLQMVEALREAGVQRIVCRVQPYFPQYREEVLESLQLMADAGAYGATFEGMKYARRRPGTVGVSGDWCFPQELLERHYEKMRDACHAAGMSFYCAEDRLRTMGDSTACCGCDGLEGFVGNRFNVVALLGGYASEPTEAMRKTGTARCLATAGNQTTAQHHAFARISFAEGVAHYLAHGYLQREDTKAKLAQDED